MAHPERVAFFLSLASSSSELMNASMTSLESYVATFRSVDGCSERTSEFSMPGYQLKPSDRSKLNWSIKGHRGMVKKLIVMLKD